MKVEQRYLAYKQNKKKTINGCLKTILYGDGEMSTR